MKSQTTSKTPKENTDLSPFTRWLFTTGGLMNPKSSEIRQIVYEGLSVVISTSGHINSTQTASKKSSTSQIKIQQQNVENDDLILAEFICEKLLMNYRYCYNTLKQLEIQQQPVVVVVNNNYHHLRHFGVHYYFKLLQEAILSVSFIDQSAQTTATTMTTKNCFRNQVHIC